MKSLQAMDMRSWVKFVERSEAVESVPPCCPSLLSLSSTQFLPSSICLYVTVCRAVPVLFADEKGISSMIVTQEAAEA